MKKVTSKLALHGGESQEVTGYRLDLNVAGFERTVPVLIHRPVGCRAGWAVSDVDTGCNMERRAPTIPTAIALVTDRLAHIGEEKYIFAKKCVVDGTK